jgi:hypothetical protein
METPGSGRSARNYARKRLARGLPTSLKKNLYVFSSEAFARQNSLHILGREICILLTEDTTDPREIIFGGWPDRNCARIYEFHAYLPGRSPRDPFGSGSQTLRVSDRRAPKLSQLLSHATPHRSMKQPAMFVCTIPHIRLEVRIRKFPRDKGDVGNEKSRRRRRRASATT